MSQNPISIVPQDEAANPATHSSAEPQAGPQVAAPVNIHPTPTDTTAVAPASPAAPATPAAPKNTALTVVSSLLVGANAAAPFLDAFLPGAGQIDKAAVRIASVIVNGISEFSNSDATPVEIGRWARLKLHTSLTEDPDAEMLAEEVRQFNEAMLRLPEAV